MRIFVKTAKAALVLAQIAVLGGWVWLYLESRSPAGARGAVLFEVAKGKAVRAIAADLRAAAVVRKKTLFLLSYDLFYAPRNVKAGEYELPKGGRIRDVLDKLIEGKVLLHPVTVPEGLTGAEIGERFIAAGFGDRDAFGSAFRDTADIALWDAKAKNLEGYLYPETYLLPKGLPAAEIVLRMTAQFKNVFGAAERAHAAELRMSLREVVTLASLIEKETALPEEKKLVSAVFHNRLRLGMKLECDPTILYALRLQGPRAGRLRTKDLKYDSPYNTYLYAGLPPGPIANPGRESLEAALYPAAADYLYFVSRNDGSHQFSRTLFEHNRAVKKYQLQIR